MHDYINHLFRSYNDDFYPSIFKSSTQELILCHYSTAGLQNIIFLDYYGTKTTTYNYIYLLYYNSSGSFFFRLSQFAIIDQLSIFVNSIRHAVLHPQFLPPAPRIFHATGGVVVRLPLSANASSGAGLIHEKYNGLVFSPLQLSVTIAVTDVNHSSFLFSDTTTTFFFLRYRTSHFLPIFPSDTFY